MSECQHCGKEFQPAKYNPSQKFCSRECMRDHAKAETAPPSFQACAGPRCPNVIRPQRSNHRFCSKACASRLGRMRRADRPMERRCANCSKYFTPIATTNKFCSTPCRAEADRARRKVAYRRNYEERIAKIRQYRKENRESNRKYSRHYRRVNKDRIAKSRRDYYERHREEILAKMKRYHQEHREEILAKTRARRQAQRKQ